MDSIQSESCNSITTQTAVRLGRKRGNSLFHEKVLTQPPWHASQKWAGGCQSMTVMVSCRVLSESCHALDAHLLWASQNYFTIFGFTYNTICLCRCYFLSGNNGNNKIWVSSMPPHHFSLIFIGIKKMEFRIFELKIGGFVKCHFFKSTNFFSQGLIPWKCGEMMQRLILYGCKTVLKRPLQFGKA